MIFCCEYLPYVLFLLVAHAKKDLELGKIIL